MTDELTPQTGSTGSLLQETSIAAIDGGLSYRGYSIEDLVEHSNFAETAFLVARGELPTSEQFADLQAVLTEASAVEPDLLSWLEQIPLNASAIDVLRTAVSLIALSDGDSDDAIPHAAWETAQRLLAQLPVLVAARYRLTRGLASVEPRDDLSFAGNLLWMLKEEEPVAAAERAFDALLILTLEHEFAPSTVTSRVIASTRADFYSAVIGGICAIKGAWHGGPGRQIIDILEAVAQPEAAATIVKVVLEQYERIPGFWHRVYKTSDPRAELLSPYCRSVAESFGKIDTELVAVAIESAVWEEQKILPSLDWPAARLMHYLNLDSDLFLPIFVISRMVSWAAHYDEQQHTHQPIRPRGRYTGPRRRQFESLEERG